MKVIIVQINVESVCKFSRNDLNFLFIISIYGEPHYNLDNNFTSNLESQPLSYLQNMLCVLKYHVYSRVWFGLLLSAIPCLCRLMLWDTVMGKSLLVQTHTLDYCYGQVLACADSLMLWTTVMGKSLLVQTYTLGYCYG